MKETEDKKTASEPFSKLCMEAVNHFVKNDIKGKMNNSNKKEKDMKELSNTITGILIWLYGIISQIMALVFFIQYCRKDSLLEIIFLDSWLSEIKGILSIFFIW